MNPLRWSVNNRPEPRSVGLLTNGLLIVAALTGAAAGLMVLEVATRNWPTGGTR